LVYSGWRVQGCSEPAFLHLIVFSVYRVIGAATVSDDRGGFLSFFGAKTHRKP